MLNFYINYMNMLNKIGIMIGVFVSVVLTLMLMQSISDAAYCAPHKHWQDLTVLYKHASVTGQGYYYGMDNNVVYKIDNNNFERGDRIELMESNCNTQVSFIGIGHINI